MNPKINVSVACAGLALLATTALAATNAKPGVSPRLEKAQPYLWGVLGRTANYLNQERQAGVDAKVLEFFWSSYFPAPGVKNQAYVTAQRKRLSMLKEHGFLVVLNIGTCDAPDWIHEKYKNTRYVNQFDKAYSPLSAQGRRMDNSGELNLVFNLEMRKLAEEFIAELFHDFPPENFDVIRIGSGRYGEIQYPLPMEEGKPAYWAYDANAQSQCPVPGWRPGQPSPNGEAAKFINWYLDRLADFQNWNIEAVRRHTNGVLLTLYPNWGLRPGDIEEAVKGSMNGKSPAERYGQLSLGLDFSRLMKAMTWKDVWVCCTCINKSDLVNDSVNIRDWSPVRYIAYLAENHPLKPPVIGENAAPHERFYMEWTLHQMEKYRLRGLFWAHEYQLFDTRTEWVHYATINDFRELINKYNQRGKKHAVVNP